MLVFISAPGLFFLKLFNWNKYFTFLERIILSYFVGTGVIGFLWLFSVKINLLFRKWGILLLLLTFSLINVKTYWNEKHEVNVNRRNFLGLSLIFAFYLVSYIILYPDHIHIITDISRHYEWSLFLAQSPTSLPTLNYILETAFESCFLALSTGSIAQNLVIFLLLNLFLPITVFTAAKRVLSNHQEKLAVIVAFFFTSLNSVWGGGIALVKYILVKIANPNLSLIEMLNELNIFSQDGLLYSVIGLWNIPNWVNLAVIFFLLGLYKNDKVSQRDLFYITSFLYILLFLIHLPEGVIVSGILSIGFLFIQDESKKLRSCVLAGITASVFAIGAFYIIHILNFFPLFSFNLLLRISLFLSLGALIISLLGHNLSAKFLPKLWREPNKVNRLLALITMFLFIFALIRKIQLMITPNDLGDLVSGEVPWYNYSLLGINFTIALIGIFFYSKDEDGNVGGFLIYNFYIALIFGKIITLINKSIIYVHYFEDRLVQFYCISMAFFASLGLASISSQLTRSKYQSVSRILQVAFIAIIVGLNFSFGAVTVEARFLMANSQYSLRDSEWHGIEQYENLFWENPNIGTVVFTDRAYECLVYTGAKSILRYNYIPNRNKTLEEFNYYSHSKLSGEEFYVFILHLSDDPYYNSLKPNFQEYLQSLPVYFSNRGILILGPIIQE
jgi:hypothetical protein